MPTAVLRRPRQKRWSLAEFYRLVDAGVFDDERVELIEGKIIQIPQQKSPHSVALAMADDAVGLAFGPGHWFRSQLPLHVGGDSAPEPDIAVMPGRPADYAGQDHPAGALLVVEVSDTTLGYDRGTKGSLYARAGIADYWIVNLNGGRLEVYRRPVPDPSRRYGFGYSSVQTFGPADTVVPLAAPGAPVKVADLLP
ncbi:MAG: Uma2 family endonuclease [Gemmataceae bacterium]